MNSKTILSLIFMIFNYSVFAGEDDEELGYAIKEQKFQVSIYTIAANKEKFNGKPVFLVGYLKFEFEHLSVYPDKSSCIDSFDENSISVGLTDAEFKSYSQKYNNCEIYFIYGNYKNMNDYSKDSFADLSLGHLDGDIKIFIR